MKYQDKELQSSLDAFSSCSEDELIIKMQKTNPECAPHIAAKILLNKKRNKKNRNIVIIAVLTLLVAALTLLAQITGFSWHNICPPIKTTQQNVSIKQKIASTPPSAKDTLPATVPQASRTKQDMQEVNRKGKEQ